MSEAEPVSNHPVEAQTVIDYSWGMFSTHSSVTQLKTDTITKCVQEAEERYWSQGDIADLNQGSHNSQDGEAQDLGSMLLNQSTSRKKIHSYFSQLESRKCCLHLACQRSTFNSMRVVPVSRTIDDGSAKNIPSMKEVGYLENEDLRAFKHAYLCAVYPVLAAPCPPSPHTPSPVYHDAVQTVPTQFTRLSSSSTGDGSTKPHITSSAQPTTSSSCPGSPRPLTPYYLNDSGVEESDETGLIPMETICEQLQRAFRLSRATFRQYEALIVKSYAKKASQRLLAEELSGQLAVLETNNHPFYSPSHFITQNGYVLWQQHERNHIAELLNKFWHLSLPFPRDHQDLIHELHSVHADYHILLTKLLTYENQFRQESGDMSHGATYTPLSSASCRLLLEFGLRYGVGELYRKILLLKSLVSDFSPTIGYLIYINNLVFTIYQMLPSNKSSVVMVKREFDFLCSSLKVLKVQTCKTLSQMKTFFPGNRPVEGIELLLALMHSVLRLMGYLTPSNQPRERFNGCLQSIVESMFKMRYEMFKSVALDDLNHGRDVGFDPRLLNVLIQDIREDVTDYKNNFESTFERYFSITKMAASSYYKYLMEDVETVSRSDIHHRPLVEIDLRMLALAYRLNQLDSDWSMYIMPQQQTWRQSLQTNLILWTTALRSHVQDFVLEAVAGDAYVSQQLNLPQPMMRYQAPSTPSDHHSISFSTMSISPSVNSAFSSVISSIHSTPHPPDCVPEGIEELMEEVFEDQETEIQNFGLTDYDLRPAKPKKSESDTKSLNMCEAQNKILNFSAFRRFSLPEKLDEAKSNDQFTINVCSKISDVKEDKTDHHSSVGKTISGYQAAEHSHTHMNGHMQTSDNEANSHNTDCRNTPVSEDEEFSFPPLKIVSSQTLGAFNVADFSKPVFSKPKTPDPPAGSSESKRRYLLRTAGPQSTSPQVSAAAEENSTRNEFTESMESNFRISPAAGPSEAVMPVSGSAIDIIVILQRLCSFSSNLVNTMLLDIPFSSTFSAGPGHIQRSHSMESASNSEMPTNYQQLARTSLSSVSSSHDTTGNFPIYDRRLSTSSTHSCSSQPQQYSSDERGFGPATPEDGQNGLPADPDQPAQTAFNFVDHLWLNRPKVKLAVHLRFLKAMCNVLTVYSTNMLCMDLCATPGSQAKRLVGPKLVELALSHHMGGLVWGCRHKVEVKHNCLFYMQRTTAHYLCDRYEPVTRYMCTRINNVAACLYLLEEYTAKLLKAFNIEEDKMKGEAGLLSEGTILSQNITNSGRESVCSEFVHVSHHILDDDSGSFNGGNTGSNNIPVHWWQESRQIVETTKQHLLSVKNGMCRLLAYKLNLFVKDSMYLVMQHKSGQVSVAKCLEPVTTFMQKYFDSFCTWLYPDCFRCILDILWVLMVQDMESRAELLQKAGAETGIHAHNWMQAIIHLIKFMNNSGKGIKKDLLLAQANNVIFRLQLYTLSTSHLIALYESLQEYYTEGDHLTIEENAARSPPAIIYRIQRELQSLRKSFSGAELVHWIMKNKDTLPADQAWPSENVTKEIAVAISQHLLDNQFIVEVGCRCPTPVPIPDVSSLSPYPEMTIHSYGHRHSDSSSTSTVGHSVMIYAELHQTDPTSSEISPSSTPTPQQDTQNGFAPIHIEEIEDSAICVSGERPGALYQDDYSDIHGQVNCQRNIIAVAANNVSSVDGNNSIEQDHAVSENHNKSTGEVHQSYTVGDFQRSALRHTSDIRQHDHSDDFMKDAVFTESNNQNTPLSSSGDHVDSLLEDEVFFDNNHRETPFSSLGDEVFYGGKFQASSRKFYLVHHSMLAPGAGSPVQDNNLHSSSSIQRESLESVSLIEQCITHKISPVTILAIIAGRTKNDIKAKNFMKSLPSSLQDRVKNILDEPGMECRSS